MFTHEKLEVYGKVSGEFQLFDCLFNTLNNDEIDDIRVYDYADQNVIEDYNYSRSLDFTTKLIELWIMECFHEALKTASMGTFIYYKHNHDDHEILELKTGMTLFEKNEFDTYVANNLNNTIELMGS